MRAVGNFVWNGNSVLYQTRPNTLSPQQAMELRMIGAILQDTRRAFWIREKCCVDLVQ